MKKFFAMMMALVMVLSMAACGSKDPETVKMRFVTGGESGTYFAFGGTIAHHATNADNNIEVTAIVGNGSQAKIQEMQKKTAELAFCHSDVMAYAYAGTNLFAKDGKVSFEKKTK